MIRRAHQIATAVFLEETGGQGVTTTQFGLLSLLQCRPNLDQITAARLLGLDRSTTGMVLNSLAEAGYVTREAGPGDKRRRVLTLTAAGRDKLDALQTPASRAVDRLLAPLDPTERPVFLGLLEKLTHALNETTRVPLMLDDPAPDRAE
jgi:DNA-binding MarR family transcriptional regulator